MDAGTWFWIIYVICLLFGLWTSWPINASNAKPFGGTLVFFILFALLGCKVFGPPVH